MKSNKTSTNSTFQSFVSLCIVATLTVQSLSAATPPSGRVPIMNTHGGLCLSPAGGDIVKITNLNSGLCLAIAGGSTERNVASVQFTCDSDPSRRWRYTAVDANSFRLVNVHSGLCLTVAGGGTDRNTSDVQFPCDGDPSRNWQVIRGQ